MSVPMMGSVSEHKKALGSVRQSVQMTETTRVLTSAHTSASVLVTRTVAMLVGTSALVMGPTSARKKGSMLEGTTELAMGYT